jgi:hypothetical protein
MLRPSKSADNNEGENSLRGLCIGRRNWLFCGSERGSRAAAIHFSLVASCKRHGHDLWVYFRDALTRLPALLPKAGEEQLLALLPHLWKPVWTRATFLSHHALAAAMVRVPRDDYEIP